MKCDCKGLVCYCDVRSEPPALTRDGGVLEDCGCVFYATESMSTAYTDSAQCVAGH